MKTNDIAFDNEKYLSTQTEAILERIACFDNKLYLEFGALSTTLRYDINSPLLTDTEYVLSLFVTRTGSSTQDIRPKVVVCGQPDANWTYALTSGAQDLTADVAISAKSKKDSAGSAADITCNYLLVLKYEK